MVSPRVSRQYLLSHPAYGPEPLVNGVSSGVSVAMQQEKFPVNEEARFDRSPYYKNKKPWDN